MSVIDKRRILETVQTIAVVGLSSRPDRPGYTVPAFMQSQGYRIVPVNPYLKQALGQTAYPDLLAVPEPVDLVLIFRRSQYIPPVVKQAITIGAAVIWMQLGITNEQAATEARAAGLKVVMDACIAIDYRRLMPD